MTHRRWLESDVVWGLTLCESRCGRVADGMMNERPLCAPCADDVVDYLAAVALHPPLREQLGELYDWSTDRRPGW